MPNRSRILLLILLITSPILFPINELVSEEGEWKIGEQRLYAIQPKPPHLQLMPQGEKGLQSFEFVTLAGVNFEQTAVPTSRFGSKKIEVEYRSSNVDGQRLTIKVDSQAYPYAVPDWQLVPITAFANSEFSAAISIYGEGPDLDRFNYIQYHEAFENTLLGLRLLQAYLILFVDGPSRVTTWDGKQVLGFGELPDSLDESEELLVLMWQAIIDSSSERSGKTYEYPSSYTITDVGQDVVLDIVDGKLVLEPNPYYFFWNSDTDEYSELVSDANLLISRYNDLGPIVSKAIEEEKYEDLIELDAEREAIEVEIERLKSAIENFKPKISPAQHVTKAVRDAYRGAMEHRPITSAVLQTGRLASLFRYVKRSNPEGWDKFVKQVGELEIETTDQNTDSYGQIVHGRSLKTERERCIDLAWPKLQQMIALLEF